MENAHYLLLVGLAVPVTYFLKSRILRLRRTMFLFDAIGIGLFTVMGLEKTLEAGLSPLIAVVMGTVSAVFGGVLRDTLSNEIPLIFRREIYATACLAGGALYLGLKEVGLSQTWCSGFAVGFVIALRLLAVWRRWSLSIIR